MAYLITTVEQDIDDGRRRRSPSKRPRLDWDGLSDLTANDLNAPAPVSREKEKTVLEAATDFLGEVLKDGPGLVQDIKEAAKENGIAWRSIQRAKAQIPVRARRRNTAGTNAREWPWEWYLADAEEESRWEY